MSTQRKIVIVTGARSDYRYIFCVLKELEDAPGIEVHLFVTGMHLESEFGNTVEEINNDGFRTFTAINLQDSINKESSIGEMAGQWVIGFAQAFHSLRPDIVLVTGDRPEMLAAATAAMLAVIPIAHIGGGELSEGAIDNNIRHAITKMANIHFCSHESAEANILRMGEKAKYIFCVGSPGLDDLCSTEPLSREEFFVKYKCDDSRALFLVTHHPTTLSKLPASRSIEIVLEALSSYDCNIIFTASNSDTGGREINKSIRKFVAENRWAKFVLNLGRRDYLSLLKYADLMIGNSSSGLCEAPTFGLPAVNIEDRQKGRLRGANVIDVKEDVDDIRRGIARAQDLAFIEATAAIKNPYFKENASSNIASTLRNIDLSVDIFS